MPTSVTRLPSATPQHEIFQSLALVQALEPQVGAFQSFDPAYVASATPRQGPLAGFTIGVKDIIDTKSFPTSYGSPIYEGFRPVADAACVALLERAGAVSMGKTVTTEFAFFRPGKTRNPHDLERTPGGSSSGSAAAVACGMVTLGLASQTAASLTRPASYCGIAGLKPSFGSYSLAGVKGLAPSFDTLGTLGPDVATLVAAHAVLGGGVVTAAAKPKKIGFCRTPWWNQGEGGMHGVMEQAALLFSSETKVTEIELDDFAEGEQLHKLIMSYEAAQALAFEFDQRAELLSSQIVGLIKTGMTISRDDYLAGRAKARILRQKMASLLDGFDILLAPAAPGEAPLAISGTGDPVFSRLWTLLRLPSVTLPGLLGPNGLPIGVQLLGRLGEDETLLAHAAWAEQVLPPRPVPAITVQI